MMIYRREVALSGNCQTGLGGEDQVVERLRPDERAAIPKRARADGAGIVVMRRKVSERGMLFDDGKRNSNVPGSSSSDAMASPSDQNSPDSRAASMDCKAELLSGIVIQSNSGKSCSIVNDPYEIPSARSSKIGRDTSVFMSSSKLALTSLTSTVSNGTSEQSRNQPPRMMVSHTNGDGAAWRLCDGDQDEQGDGVCRCGA